MRHIMVDIETTGVNPDRNGILQIAAWKFDPINPDISPEFFDRCLMLPAHRHWSEDTRSWWLQDKRELLMSLLNRGEDPKQVMSDFKDWCDPSTSPIFWSKPSHFDYMFISSYFGDCGVMNPFHYRSTTDMNSFLRGLYRSSEIPDIDVPFTGEVHNALYDAMHQIQCIWAHVQNTAEVVLEA